MAGGPGASIEATEALAMAEANGVDCIRMPKIMGTGSESARCLSPLF